MVSHADVDQCLPGKFKSNKTPMPHENVYHPEHGDILIMNCRYTCSFLKKCKQAPCGLAVNEWDRRAVKRELTSVRLVIGAVIIWYVP